MFLRTFLVDHSLTKFALRLNGSCCLGRSTQEARNLAETAVWSPRAAETSVKDNEKCGQFYLGDNSYEGGSKAMGCRCAPRPRRIAISLSPQLHLLIPQTPYALSSSFAQSLKSASLQVLLSLNLHAHIFMLSGSRFCLEWDIPSKSSLLNWLSVDCCPTLNFWRSLEAAVISVQGLWDLGKYIF